jgi:hypothetical protein
MKVINNIMADITKTENKFLNSLIEDCITYRLTEKEDRKYIKSKVYPSMSLFIV